MKNIFRVCLNFCLLASAALTAQTAPVDLHQDVAKNFSFIAYGDTRFTVSPDPAVSNAPARRELVSAITRVRPAFLCMTGDLVYVGADPGDWRDWDDETAAFRSAKIPVYPALGNHEVRGGEQAGLANYFQRFPELHESRYYSARVGNVLLLTLDSNLDVSTGPQDDWLSKKLDNVPSSVDFVVILLHHPPITTAIDNKDPEHKPEIRAPEQLLGRRLEERQKTTRARFVIVSGHVHNYERHQRNGITYFVSGGGGAHAYPIQRDPKEPYFDGRINYHYLLFEVAGRKLNVTMNRVEVLDGKANWTRPDSVTLEAPTSRLALTPANVGQSSHSK